jgi:hypothetical protein
MLDLTSDLPLFHERGESENSSSRSSDSGLEIPTSFQLLDISEDNKFLALIDDNSMLQVYELNDIKDQLTAKRQTMTDIPCEIKCKNSIFVYISVASETGHVAVSFLQTDKRGDPFENSSKFDQFTKFKIHRKNDTKEEKEQQHCNEEGKETLDNNYSTCRIYQGNQGHVLEKPFQGRAAFTKNRLILIGQYTLDIYDANTLNKMYFFKHGGFCLNKQIYQGRNWYRGYFLQDECAKLPNAGYGLVRISEHVRKNVIVVYDEDCSVYRRTSVKIWSILTGSLICSFMQIDDEQVIYVSEDHRFLVSQKVFRGALNIYCMKSGAHLYMYEPQKVSDGILRYNIMLVKPIANQNYMLLIGTVFRRNCGSDESEGLSFANYLFFEIFLIEQQTTVKDIQTSMIIGLNSHLALGIFQNEDFINTTSQFYGVFWEKMNNDDRYLNLRTIQFNFPSSDSIHLTYPTSNGLLQNTLWNIFKCTHIGTEDEGGFRRALTSHDFRYDDGFTSDDKTIVYLLENSIHKYVLIISPYIVQLWRLYKDEALEYNTLFFDSLPRKKNCYLDFHDNSLIYTRSHYGLNYEESACGDTPKLMLEGENQYYRPRVQFLENLGHIFVHVESKSGSSISEEIILPLSVSQSTDNSDDTINDLSQDEFHSIERCLLSFLHTYWSREQVNTLREYSFNYMFMLYI